MNVLDLQLRLLRAYKELRPLRPTARAIAARALGVAENQVTPAQLELTKGVIARLRGGDRGRTRACVPAPAQYAAVRPPPLRPHERVIWIDRLKALLRGRS